jgi:hypothetical protein
MKAKWMKLVIAAALVVLVLYLAQKLYAAAPQATSEQMAQMQAQQQQMQESMMANMRKMKFVNKTDQGYWLNVTFKGSNNCKKQTAYVYPQNSGQVAQIMGADKSCCLTSFELVYVPASANAGTQQTWYSQSNLNNGNGICADTTFNIVVDTTAQYGIRTDWIVGKYN